ncbi:MAG: PTS sugar transporter subunit IIA [Candidatus Marinimicrobia bacterium]|nr:PTS sugar transporter subunit IIA [Candidatus Neomarinimicrobiota bacterium]MCF7829098.1 PTS sugar transporter subunit IIA [Candidatus Neomarinimicrobiota bacterium]MCF7881503.1 PTS sugar transporter subunit IIA [Candidatus Neomarinimicrobiota bacterium]
MDLESLLQPETILIDWHPATKDDAIASLVEAMADAGVIQDREIVLHDVQTREQSLSTGLGDGIAYPHARSSAVDSVAMAFGIVREGLEFESRDGEPAIFIPLMVSPKDGGAPHLYVMAEIVKKLEDQDVREQLLDAESPEEVYRILAE